MRAIISLAGAAALVLALSPGARADEYNKLTYMTFSGPVQVPGATLPAGTYTFKLADLQTDRHIVQIFNKATNKLITTVMTIPNDRIEPVKDTFVMFSERPAGVPIAVKAWFYPGRSIGEEFLYPRHQATEIARKAHDTVLTTQGEEVTRTGSTARVNEQGKFTADNNTAASAGTSRAPSQSANRADAAATAAATSGSAASAPASARAATATGGSNARAAVGTAGQANGSQAPATTARTARTLPRTASPLGLFELLSGLSLAAAFGLRRMRRHSAALDR